MAEAHYSMLSGFLPCLLQMGLLPLDFKAPQLKIFFFLRKRKEKTTKQSFSSQFQFILTSFLKNKAVSWAFGYPWTRVYNHGWTVNNWMPWTLSAIGAMFFDQLYFSSCYDGTMKAVVKAIVACYRAFIAFSNWAYFPRPSKRLQFKIFSPQTKERKNN